MLFKDIYTY